jgi:type I restriction enzyme M protein
VDPKKNETVLDPACGTAGFLISAFKHIVRNNESLTPDERARLMTNFRGYDIAPDMVRLSRVNLYLHGFPQPVIHEYDTLTSEERWDERCDVIMANPPFMTPKGGIRPHNRFSIKAKRSEVLFVDCIAEHLTPGGRAGIIVPEGIIFQSQNAYKALRKMLVENYLWAVVSLPAGVFNPYSGVKTSILFLDRNLARRTDDVVFVKVENDGFDLGAQRRPIEKNDLQEALEILNGHNKAQRAQESKMSLTVSRKYLLESGDVNLSGGLYRVVAAVQSKWPMVKLGEVIRTITPPKKIQKAEFGKAGTYPIIDQSQDEIVGWTDDSAAAVNVAKPVVIFGDHTCSVKYTERPFVQGADGIKILETSDSLQPRFLFYWLKTFPIQSDGYKRHFSKLVETVIPLPPLEEQERIVAELDGYWKVIEGARQVLANYKPTIKIDSEWPVVKLGEVCRIDAPLVDPKLPQFRSLPHVSGENIESGTGALLKLRSAAEDKVISGKYAFKAGAVLYSKLRPYLCKAALAASDGLCSADMYPLMVEDSQVDARFLLHILLSDHFTRYAVELSGRARMPKLNREDLMSYEIPLPPLDIQREIVAEIEAERALVEANRKLMELFEKKIQSKLAEVWGEEENSRKEAQE